MKELIREAIDWTIFDNRELEKIEFDIEGASLSADAERLRIKMTLNFVLPYNECLKICGIITNRMKTVYENFKETEILFEYEPIVTDENQAAIYALPHIFEMAKAKCSPLLMTVNPDAAKVCDKAQVSAMASGVGTAAAPEQADASEIIIPVVGAKIADELNGKTSERLQLMLEQKMKIKKKIVFKNNEELLEQIVESSVGSEEAALAEAKEEAKIKAEKLKKAGGGNGYGSNGNGYGAPGGSNGYGSSNGGGYNNGGGRRRRKKETPVEGNRIMGTDITGPVTPLGEVEVEKGNVIVEGILFMKEERTIKSGNKLVKLLITDRKTSLCIKTFASEQKWNDIDTHIKNGDGVKVQGEVQYDTYDNSIIVMADSIERSDPEVREDKSDEKRVELHLHTKMSAMDGFCDTKAAIKQAAAWGHKAIAITDHGVVQSFPDAVHTVYDGGMNEKTMDIKVIYGVEAYLYDDEGYIDEDGNINYKAHGYNHAILLAKNQAGIKNLYRLVSMSHIDYMYKRPRMPKSVISKYREGLILGSACEAGEVFRALTSGKSDEEIKKKAEFYDYLEIQPIANNRFMLNSKKYPDVNSEEDLRQFNREIIRIGQEMNKPVVATCDAHYLNSEDSKYREIILTGQGYKDVEGGLYFRTTDEMLEEFAYLGDDMARKTVIENPNLIADMIEEVLPIAKGKFPPKIENADEILRNACYERAANMYGDPLPEFIQKRLDKELDSIIGNGYAVMYVSAEMLVNKSMSDGFLVGSRGSVGSSFAATMAGITEVNPLPPHYLCPQCKHLEWGDEKEYDCGVDMPEKMCPECGTKMKQDGFGIPFETFLGFDGDKEPDIDLNFAGEYQATAHKYVEEIFGSGNVYKAGTIGALKEKTAFGFVRKYFDEKEIPVNSYEVERLKTGCVGVKRTTGQHPGGIIIVPEGHEIYEFCPVQHPANDTETDIVTTHFDYHSIDQNLLKLDILGHDVPSMIRHLQDFTGLDPMNVPLRDEKVNSIFNGIEGLEIKDPDYKFTHGSYGIPEFGTKFVRQMLDDTTPSRFGDLVRISGFSHGTNVWLNNAQEFIKNGQATMKDAISTRDDIMNYLILKGVPNGKAFKIMEKVRKGKGVSDENVEIMKEHDVPDWYIESCQRISYMFPRAHAVAYVIMSYRIAYYKVHYPAAFYAVFFTTKIADFNWNVIQQGSDAILKRMDEIKNKGKNATPKEESEIIPLELAYEMYARGYEFASPALEDSEADIFTLKDGKVLVPLAAMEGVGETAAKDIKKEYDVKPFMTVEDMVDRAKVNKTALAALRACGVLDGIPESDQLCMF